MFFETECAISKKELMSIRIESFDIIIKLYLKISSDKS